MFRLADCVIYVRVTSGRWWLSHADSKRKFNQQTFHFTERLVWRTKDSRTKRKLRVRPGRQHTKSRCNSEMVQRRRQHKTKMEVRFWESLGDWKEGDYASSDDTMLLFAVVTVVTDLKEEMIMIMFMKIKPFTLEIFEDCCLYVRYLHPSFVVPLLILTTTNTAAFSLFSHPSNSLFRYLYVCTSVRPSVCMYVSVCVLPSGGVILACTVFFAFA